MNKIKLTTIEPIGDFLKSLINIEAKFKEYGFIMRAKKKNLWQGTKIKIPTLAQTAVKAKGNTLTLKKLEKLYKVAKKFEE